MQFYYHALWGSPSRLCHKDRQEFPSAYCKLDWFPVGGGIRSSQPVMWSKRLFPSWGMSSWCILWCLLGFVSVDCGIGLNLLVFVRGTMFCNGSNFMFYEDIRVLQVTLQALLWDGFLKNRLLSRGLGVLLQRPCLGCCKDRGRLGSRLCCFAWKIWNNKTNAGNFILLES